MESSLKYIEDKMVVFDMDPIFRRRIRKYSEEIIHEIIFQIIVNIDDLPKKDYYIQDVCSVIKKKKPLFYRLEYINESDDFPTFINISEITIDDYLDAIDENKYFKETENYE